MAADETPHKLRKFSLSLSASARSALAIRCLGGGVGGGG